MHYDINVPFCCLDRGDHLDQGDIMFHKGEEKAEFGIGPVGDEESLNKVSHDATIYKRKRWSMPVPYQIEKSLGRCNL